MMNVTKVQVFPFKENPNLSTVNGLAIVEIEGAIVIRGIKIIKPHDSDELVVGYPIDPFYKDEEYKNLVFFTDPSLKAEVEKQIIDKYNELIKKE
jgi:stage V sporulation protein G